MKSLLLAIALLNAAPKEQDRLILDLYDMDPRLVADVLDVVDELGGYTDDLAIVEGRAHWTVTEDTWGAPLPPVDQPVELIDDDRRQ